MREPNFENLLSVLRCESPERPTLFEFFLNQPLYERLAGPDFRAGDGPLDAVRLVIEGFKNAGYDYATITSGQLQALAFPRGAIAQLNTRSLNEGAVITDRASFEAYQWMDPGAGDYSLLEAAADVLPDGMKLIVAGPGGVLENAIALVGFERLCFMCIDDPDLAGDVFAAVGSRLVTYYSRCAVYDTVGAAISNDDWGFKTQPLLSPTQLRRFVFPWHRRIVEAVHAAGKPVVLHSCGNPESIIDDVIDDMSYDGRHSYEDTIIPVEDAYERWGERIAIVGGIDVDFMVRASTDEIYRRSKAMLERAAGRGGYALGTGNSVPEYIPQDKYFAMIRAATEG